MRGDDGQWHESAAAVEDALWRSRADMWGSVPPPPEARRALLDAYFRRGKAIDLPGGPAPKYGKLAALILSPAGGAPGVTASPAKSTT